MLGIEIITIIDQDNSYQYILDGSAVYIVLDDGTIEYLYEGR